MSLSLGECQRVIKFVTTTFEKSISYKASNLIKFVTMTSKTSKYLKVVLIKFVTESAW